MKDYVVGELSFDRDPAEPLSNQELHEVIHNLWEQPKTFDTSSLGRLTPVQVARLEDTPMGDQDSVAAAAAFSIMAGTFVGRAVAETVIEHNPSIPPGPTLPLVAREVMERLFMAVPGTSESIAMGPLRDQAPTIALSAVILGSAAGVTKAALDHRHEKSLKADGRRTQAHVAELVDNGLLRWSMPTGSTIAFVGKGDAIGIHLAQKHRQNFLQLADRPVKGLWTRLPFSEARTPSYDAFDRADLAHVCQAMFLPGRSLGKYLDLPKPDDAMRIDRIQGYIEDLDYYCDQAGLDKLPLIVVGDMQQTESYSLRAGSQQMVSSGPTLGEFLADYGRQRTAPMHPIDPVKIVGDAVLKQAEGRPISLFSTTASADGSRSALDRLVYHEPDSPNERAVRVLVGDSDQTTANAATPDDISVVFSTSQRDVMARRVPKERVLVVRDLVRAEIDQFFPEPTV